MYAVKDPEIKLFGKTISLTPRGDAAPASDIAQEQQKSSCSTSQDHQSNSGGEFSGIRLKDDPINLTEDELVEPETPSGDCESPKTPGGDTETLSPKFAEKEEQSETSASQETTLKKPDKILPCPRCNSMDTKFCYFNNYNVSQPRHFCKNCQRYWTAGGTMRNVPVGSGRRKNKCSGASNYHHITVSEALHLTQADAANGNHLSPLKADSTLADKVQYYIPNGFQGDEPRISIYYGATEIGRDHPNSQSSVSLKFSGKESNAGQETELRNCQGIAARVPCFSGSPWPSQLTSAHWSAPAFRSAFNPSAFPVTFYPATPYWGCTVPVPLNPSLPILGKHNRDGSILKPSLGKEEPVEENGSERNILLPKSLRIDHSDESSRTKKQNTDSFTGASVFRAFCPKVNGKNHVTDTSLILHANPAAFARSVNFLESAS